MAQLPKKGHKAPSKDAENTGHEPGFSHPSSSTTIRNSLYFRNMRQIVAQIVASDKNEKKWQDIRIYFGCPAKRDRKGGYLPDSKQPKSLSKDWYIEGKYWVKEVLEWVRFKVKRGINREKTIQSRYVVAKVFEDQLEKDLQRGWIPPEAKKMMVQKLPRSRHLTLYDGIELYISNHETRYEKKDINKKTLQDYRNGLRLFQQYAKELGHAIVPADKIETVDIIETLDFMQKERIREGGRFGTIRYNCVKGFVSQTFIFLKTKGHIKSNPLEGIKGQKVRKKKRARLTDKERDIIREQLPAQDPEYYFYFLFRWYTAMRKTESLQIIVEDIDLHYCPEFGLICLPFEGDRRVPKGDHTRYAIITPQLRQLIIERGIMNHRDKKDFLFSKGFLPGPNQLPINLPTTLWRVYVKEGMGIPKDMYSHKGLVLDEMALAGVDRSGRKAIAGHDDEASQDPYMTMEQIAEFKKHWNNVPTF